MYLVQGLNSALLIHIAVAFPNGRPATRFGRVVIVIAYI